jgi:hypothetical protein
VKRHHVFLIVLVAAAAMAFGAGPALADGINFDPATGVFTYFAYPNALANQNDITVRRPATGGFSTWSRIDSNWYVVGDPTPDANVVKYCFKEEWKYWSCPATKVVVRTAKGDDKITVEPDLNGFELAKQLAALGTRPAVVLTSSRDRSEFGQLIADSPVRGFIPKEELSSARLAALLE